MGHRCRVEPCSSPLIRRVSLSIDRPGRANTQNSQSASAATPATLKVAHPGSPHRLAAAASGDRRHRRHDRQRSCDGRFVSRAANCSRDRSSHETAGHALFGGPWGPDASRPPRETAWALAMTAACEGASRKRQVRGSDNGLPLLVRSSHAGDVPAAVSRALPDKTSSQAPRGTFEREEQRGDDERKA
jgi:hypothetical protein